MGAGRLQVRPTHCYRDTPWTACADVTLGLHSEYMAESTWIINEYGAVPHIAAATNMHICQTDPTYSSSVRRDTSAEQCLPHAMPVSETASLERPTSRLLLAGR